MADLTPQENTVLGGATLPQVRAQFGAGMVFYLGTTSQNAGILADDNGPGTSPNRPYSTLAAAYAAAVDSRGDVIYVLENHTASIVAATTHAKIGLKIIGLGEVKPTFTLTTLTSAKYTMNAAGMVLENIRFVGNFNAIVAAIGVTAADCVIRGCEITLATSTNYTLVGILTSAAADRLLIENCKIVGLTFTAGAAVHTNGIQIVGGTGVTIRNCRIAGRFSATLGVIQVVTTAATSLTVEACQLENYVTSAAKTFVDTITGTTGRFTGRNRHQILTGTAPITAATMSWGDDVYAATIATAMVTV